MKKNRNRLISLLLVLAMMLSLGAGALAAESEPDGSVSAVTVEDVQPESESVQQEDESAPTEDASDASAEDPADESVVTEPEQDPASEPEAEVSAQAQAAEDASEDAEAAQGAAEDLVEQEDAELTIKETIPLTVEYDDRFTFSEVKKGYVVAQIQKQTVTSYKVAEGQKTENKDRAVLTVSNDTDAIAVGTGTATVLLVKKGDLAAAKKLLDKDSSATESVDAVQVDVEVEPAPLTIMFLGGQSNMEGWGSDPGHGAAKTFQHAEQSVVCPEGEVYSTYAPGKTAIAHRANSIGGNVNFRGTYCKSSNAKSFIAQCLTGSNSGWSLKGTQLAYPLTQLTSAGTGKSGPDSGLAYEWNRLTGDKVWTVNAAQGSSTIEMWTPGKDCYKRAYAVFGYALKVYKQEIKAGHYKAGHQLFFWLQGEHNSTTSGSKYWNDFYNMHKNLKKDLANIYGEGWEQMGIITVRATGPKKSGKTYRSAKDIIMTGPRVVQSYAANTRKLEDVHIVSDVNEQWVSDSGVKTYFDNAYNGKLSYTIHSGSLSLPTKVSQVHNDIHYTQVAHNENGITAAQGMYQVCTDTNLPQKVRWRSYYSKNLGNMNLARGESAFVVPAVSPVSASKTVKWRFSDGLSYSGTSGKVKVTAGGVQKIEAVAVDEDGNSTVLSTLRIATGKALSAPSLKSASNVKGKKIKAAWKGVSGADGYQIQCSLKSDFSSSVKTLSVSGTSATLSGFKSGKTYYIRVRAWREDDDGKVNSKWSGKKSVKISK